MTTNAFSPPEYKCADDLMRAAIRGLVESQDRFSGLKGDGGVEILGASFRLTNPRARISRSEMRGKVYSALGELFWCLSGSNKLSFIEHYLKDYSRNSDDGKTVHGAYGPRLFGERDLDQVRNMVDLLNRRRNSKRAVIQIFSSSDIVKDYKDVPCTCTLQAILRSDQLHLITHMRSNDAYLGLPHDIFVFTMLQELIARSLGAEIGFYQHMVGHLHLYDKHRDMATAYLSEGFQSIEPMPPMPQEDPLPLLPKLLEAEEAIRTGPASPPVSQFHPYWEDILRLLRIYSENRHKLDGYRERVEGIRAQMSSSAYDVYFA
ncbi:thymidylate synthase [Sorangium sp. So ce327]|uniref:thymidylate synthase n=1 Tax=Sorangium sp. So ce327 TaxID=3133301 RepID=UPI003F632F1C